MGRGQSSLPTASRVLLALPLSQVTVGGPQATITRLDPWEYDQEVYKTRNRIERLFRRLKGYRRIFSRFDKLDIMFLASSPSPSSTTPYEA